MRIYRTCRIGHLENFEGQGASFRHGRRWNKAGVPVLYFAESASVAMLEMANYLPSPRLVPTAYRLGVYEVASSAAIKRWHVSDLPKERDVFPRSQWTRQAGTEWLLHGKESLLSVPSAAVPGGLENIVLASPHRLAPARIRLIEALEDLYDSRAFAIQLSCLPLNSSPDCSDAKARRPSTAAPARWDHSVRRFVRLADYNHRLT